MKGFMPAVDGGAGAGAVGVCAWTVHVEARAKTPQAAPNANRIPRFISSALLLFSQDLSSFDGQYTEVAAAVDPRRQA